MRTGNNTATRVRRRRTSLGTADRRRGWLAALAAVAGALYTFVAMGTTPEGIAGMVTLALGVVLAETGVPAHERLAQLASWLAPLQAVYDVGVSAVVALAPLLFMRAPTGVWIGAILDLVAPAPAPSLARPARVPR
jgi:hypothetical protein